MCVSVLGVRVVWTLPALKPPKNKVLHSNLRGGGGLRPIIHLSPGNTDDMTAKSFQRAIAGRSLQGLPSHPPCSDTKTNVVPHTCHRKRLPMPHNFAQSYPGQGGGSKKWSISWAVWEPKGPQNRPISWKGKYLLWAHLNNPEKGLCFLSVIKNTPTESWF